MKRKEWLVSSAILLVLAVVAVAGTIHVMNMQDSERLEQFSNRFVPLSSLKLNAREDISLTHEEKRTLIQWEDGTSAFEVRTADIPLEQAKRLLVNATLGGTQNGYARSRWGYRIYMELQTLDHGQVIDSHRVEAPFTTYRKDRGRIFAAEANARNADAYRVVFTVEPMDQALPAGEFFISYWEVYAK